MQNERRKVQNIYISLEIVKIGQFLAEQHSGELVEFGAFGLWFDLVAQIGANLDTAL